LGWESEIDVNMISLDGDRDLMKQPDDPQIAAATCFIILVVTHRVDMAHSRDYSQMLT
jgi:hypothetical protein